MRHSHGETAGNGTPLNGSQTTPPPDIRTCSRVTFAMAMRARRVCAIPPRFHSILILQHANPNIRLGRDAQQLHPDFG